MEGLISTQALVRQSCWSTRPCNHLLVNILSNTILFIQIVLSKLFFDTVILITYFGSQTLPVWAFTTHAHTGRVGEESSSLPTSCQNRTARHHALHHRLPCRKRPIPLPPSVSKPSSWLPSSVSEPSTSPLPSVSILSPPLLPLA